MKAPKCRLCGESHWGPDHIWQDEDKKKKIAEVVAGIPVVVASECVHTRAEPDKNCVHNEGKSNSGVHIRQVGIRELRVNLSKELQNLPFAITKGGIVIAVVQHA